MSKTSEVDLRVELEKNSYIPGETIVGTAQVRTTRQIYFKSASLVWQTNAQTIDTKSGIENRATLLSNSQPIVELTEALLNGEVSVSIRFKLPDDIPSTIELDLFNRISITTTLTVSLVMREPLYSSIIRDYPVKIIKRPYQTHGILQSIEFPTKGCCTTGEIAKAHIELLRTTYTVGDKIEATIVMDLSQSGQTVRGATVSLKKIILWRTNGHSGPEVEEHELFEGPRTAKIHARKKSAVTVVTRIPEFAFSPDVETKTISIEHAALFLFYCGSYIVETEIPITLIYPEAMTPEG